MTGAAARWRSTALRRPAAAFSIASPIAFTGINSADAITPRTAAAALAVAATLFVLGLFLRHLAARHARTLTTEGTHLELSAILTHVLARTSLPFLLVVATAVGLQMLPMSARAELYQQRALTIAVFWQLGLWLATAAGEWLHVRRERSIAGDKAALGTLAILAAVVPAVIWVVMLLLALDNLGINVTTLIAGLGIGGVAIALAVQNVLGDLLASLSIAFDKPFVIGDFIVIDAFMGSVEYIGMKTTRLRSLDGEQIVMSNSNLLAARLRNYGRMQDRRVQYTLTVASDTPRSALRELPRAVADVLRSQSGIRFERSHIASFSGGGLNVECVYTVLSADYNNHMDIQQQLILRMHEVLEAAGVKLAGMAQPPVA